MSASLNLSTQLQSVAEHLDALLEEIAGERCSFVLVIQADKVAQYVSNTERADGAELIESLLARWRAGRPAARTSPPTTTRICPRADPMDEAYPSQRNHMSHFTVLVVGDDIEAQLQPFHEFECTGTSDQYVVDIDETDEKREEFATETRSVIKLASGELVSAYDERWYRPTKPGEESSGGRYGKVRDLPAGVVEIEAPFESVEAWADYHGHKLIKVGEEPDLQDEHKFGYVVIDEAGAIVKAIRRTNPNKTWDWWQVGGRWSGFLKLKPGAAGTLGRRGLMGSHANDGPGYADQAKKGDIDFAGMRDAAGREAGQRWDKARAGFAPDAEWITWEQMREVIHKGDIEAARKAYNEQPAVAAIHKALDSFYTRADDFLVSRDAYVQQARDGAISTYAMVKDSQWFAKGRMGWWACSDDKMTQQEWNRELTAMLDALPDDTLLSVVDCHI